MLSLDSPHADVYESIRVGASFSDVLIGGEKLAAQGILHSLNVALSKHNYRDLPGIFSLAEQMGTGIVNILGLKPCERYEAQLLTKEEYEIAIRSACESASDRVSFFFDEPFFHAAAREWGIELPEPSEDGKILAPESSACIFGDYVFIEPNGEVKPCTFAPYVLGNAQDGISDVWQSMQTSEFLAQIRDPVTRTGYCRTCEHLSICKGCRSRTYALTGDWFASDPACPLAKNG
jgi:radical SAM protein with 4Fe4S-binding SPASM domain